MRASGSSWLKKMIRRVDAAHPSQSPVAQCGLYPQFHRDERAVYNNLRYLYQKRNGTVLPVRNVPNKYLAPKP
jgi:hypothetical protein